MNQYPVIMMVLLLAGAAIIPLLRIKQTSAIHGFVMMIITGVVVLGILNYQLVLTQGESLIFFGGYSSKVGIVFEVSQLASLFSLFVLILSWIVVLYSLKDMDHHISKKKFGSYYTLIFLMLFSMIFFILLSLWCIQRTKFDLAFLLLGLAVAIRYYPLFLLPFFLFSLPGGAKEQAKRLGLALLPWLLVNLWTLSGRGDAELISFVNYPYERYLLPLHLPVAAWDNIYIFPLAYFILLLHRIYNAARGPQSLFQYSLMAILLLQALTYMGQAPHYWIWFIPLMSLVFVTEDRIVLLHAAQVAALFLYGMIGSRATAGYLFASISPEFFWGVLSPIEWIGEFVPAELVISLSHTAFTAVTLWVLWIAYQKMDVHLMIPRRVS